MSNHLKAPQVTKLIKKCASSNAIRKKMEYFGIKQPSLTFASHFEDLIQLIILISKTTKEEYTPILLELEPKFRLLASERSKISPKIAEISFGQIMHLIDLFHNSDDPSLKYFSFYLMKLWIQNIQLSEEYLDAILRNIEEQESFTKDVFIFLQELCVSRPDVLEKILKTISAVIQKISTSEGQISAQEQSVLSSQQNGSSTKISEDFLEFMLNILQTFQSSQLEKDIVTLVHKSNLTNVGASHSIILGNFLSNEDNFDKCFSLSIEFFKRGLECEDQNMIGYVRKIDSFLRRIKISTRNQDEQRMLMDIFGPLFVLRNSQNAEVSRISQQVWRGTIESDKEIEGKLKEYTADLLVYVTGKAAQNALESSTSDKFTAAENSFIELADKILSEEDVDRMSQLKKIRALTNMIVICFSIKTSGQNQQNLSSNSMIIRGVYSRFVQKSKLKPNLQIQALLRAEWKHLVQIDVHGFSEYMSKLNIDVSSDLKNNTQLVSAAAYLLFVLNGRVMNEDIENKFKSINENPKALFISNLDTIHGFLMTHSSLPQAKDILLSHIPNYFKLDRIPQLRSLESLYTQAFIYSAVKDHSNKEVSLALYNKNQNLNITPNTSKTSPPYEFTYKSFEQKRMLYAKDHSLQRPQEDQKISMQTTKSHTVGEPAPHKKEQENKSLIQAKQQTKVALQVNKQVDSSQLPQAKKINIIEPEIVVTAIVEKNKQAETIETDKMEIETDQKTSETSQKMMNEFEKKIENPLPSMVEESDKTIEMDQKLSTNTIMDIEPSLIPDKIQKPSEKTPLNEKPQQVQTNAKLLANNAISQQNQISQQSYSKPSLGIVSGAPSLPNLNMKGIQAAKPSLSTISPQSENADNTKNLTMKEKFQLKLKMAKGELNKKSEVETSAEQIKKEQQVIETENVLIQTPQAIKITIPETLVSIKEPVKLEETTSLKPQISIPFLKKKSEQASSPSQLTEIQKQPSLDGSSSSSSKIPKFKLELPIALKSPASQKITPLLDEQISLEEVIKTQIHDTNEGEQNQVMNKENQMKEEETKQQEIIQKDNSHIEQEEGQRIDDLKEEETKQQEIIQNDKNFIEQEEGERRDDLQEDEALKIEAEVQDSQNSELKRGEDEINKPTESEQYHHAQINSQEEDIENIHQDNLQEEGQLNKADEEEQFSCNQVTKDENGDALEEQEQQEEQDNEDEELGEQVDNQEEEVNDTMIAPEDLQGESKLENTLEEENDIINTTQNIQEETEDGDDLQNIIQEENDDQNQNINIANQNEDVEGIPNQQDNIQDEEIRVQEEGGQVEVQEEAIQELEEEDQGQQDVVPMQQDDIEGEEDENQMQEDEIQVQDNLNDNAQIEEGSQRFLEEGQDDFQINQQDNLIEEEFVEQEGEEVDVVEEEQEEDRTGQDEVD